MQKDEQFLIKREIRRLIQDLNNCYDSEYKELIREDITLLSTVLDESE
ncbi:hypothetical protein ACKA06_10795 [Rossellomorea oryzaecorticis]|jgi:hypothetical protein|uniref:Uncharacterized protein n=1 Tax=Rossellomorea oryzaecorticis TaxID=1396505 RepID=A0ABW8VPI5_9BACI|nr:hypothetical protein KJK41_04030 [Bacillus haikouensis]